MTNILGHLSEGTQAMLKDRLVKDEKIVAVSRVSGGIYWKSIAVFVVGLLFAVFVAPRLGFLLFFVAFVMWAYAALRQRVILVVMTDKRVLVRSGIIKVDMVDIRFDKIESFELEQMLTGYVMGYATLVVMGTGNRYIGIPYLANGYEIRKAFNEIVLDDDQ